MAMYKAGFSKCLHWDSETWMARSIIIGRRKAGRLTMSPAAATKVMLNKANLLAGLIVFLENSQQNTGSRPGGIARGFCQKESAMLHHARRFFSLGCRSSLSIFCWSTRSDRDWAVSVRTPMCSGENTTRTPH